MTTAPSAPVEEEGEGVVLVLHAGPVEHLQEGRVRQGLTRLQHVELDALGALLDERGVPRPDLDGVHKGIVPGGGDIRLDQARPPPRSGRNRRGGPRTWAPTCRFSVFLKLSLDSVPVRRGRVPAPDRHMVGAAGVERATVPVGPAMLERHSVEARHEIEFGRPGVAVDQWKAPRAPVLIDDDLRRRQGLAGRIMVLDDEAGVTPAKAPRLQAEAVTPRRIGNPGFDHEASAGSEVAGRVGEAADLILLCVHGVDGVDQQDDEVELAVRLRGGEVPAHRADLVAARPIPEELQHLRGAVDAPDVQPSLRQREGDPARAHAEFEDPAAIRQMSQISQSIYGAIGVEDTLINGVVLVGKECAVRCGVVQVAVHGVHSEVRSLLPGGHHVLGEILFDQRDGSRAEQHRAGLIGFSLEQATDQIVDGNVLM